MCGGVEMKTVYVGAVQARAVLVSRLSCERMGQRVAETTRTGNQNIKGCRRHPVPYLGTFGPSMG